MIKAYIDYEYRNLKIITYYVEVVFFNKKFSFLVLGLYFLSFNLSLLFLPL